MALPSYDTTVFLAAVKRRSFRPASDGLFTDADILALGDEEIAGALYPMIMAVRQEFFVMTSDVPLASLTPVLGLTTVQLPSRATAEALRDVQLVDSGGGIMSVPRLEPDQLTRFGAISGSGLLGFYLQDNAVVLVGTPGAYTTVRLSYFVRPAKMAANVSTTFGVVSAINTGTGVVTLVSTKPTTFDTSAKLDFISYTSRFQYISLDQTPTAASGTSLTFASIPATLKVGDFIALQGQTPVPQVPAELHPYLYQRVACAMLESAGETTRAQTAQKRLSELEKRAFSAFVDRVPGAPRKLVNVNGVGGVLNCGTRGRYSGFGGSF